MDEVIEHMRVQQVKVQGGRRGMKPDAVAILHQTVADILAYIEEKPLREVCN